MRMDLVIVKKYIDLNNFKINKVVSISVTTDPYRV